MEISATSEVLKQLGQVPLFRQLSEKEREGLLKTAKQQRFAGGETIVREGEVGIAFYLILKGQVEVRRAGKALARLGAGQFFGEMALLADYPRSADVAALEETTCLLLTRWDLRALLQSHPEMAFKMLEELARRLRDTDRTLSE
jgi:CRP/FNR family transcriptional regulator/voltage-gated potassium channel